MEGGKNANIEKNYPIMPKAQRNYERCYTASLTGAQKCGKRGRLNARRKRWINRISFRRKTLPCFVSLTETRPLLFKLDFKYFFEITRVTCRRPNMRRSNIGRVSLFDWRNQHMMCHNNRNR